MAPSGIDVVDIAVDVDVPIRLDARPRCIGEVAPGAQLDIAALGLR